jgi:hypothetical protein
MNTFKATFGTHVFIRKTKRVYAVAYVYVNKVTGETFDRPSFAGHGQTPKWNVPSAKYFNLEEWEPVVVPVEKINQ